jgi:predicted ABC-type ATPase
MEPPNDARLLNFVNVNLIASGLSPLRPELSAGAAARLMLDEIDRLAERRADFAWEGALSGLGHVKRSQIMKRLGYHVETIYLRLASSTLALIRIAARVRQGGTTCQGPTYCNASPEAGGTSKLATGCFQPPGRCTTIPASRRS